MGLFGFRKKDNVLDLSERYRKQKQKEKEMMSDSAGSSDSSQESGSATPFSFFDSGSSGAESSSSSGSSQEDSDVLDLSGGNYPEGGEKKKRLAKRILDMTTKIEDLSNQIYHLQQRIEVLERKSGSVY